MEVTDERPLERPLSSGLGFSNAVFVVPPCATCSAELTARPLLKRPYGKTSIKQKRKDLE